MAKVCKRNGQYELDYYFNGKRIRKRLPKDVTKKEADAAMRDIQTQIFKGLYSLKEIPTFRAVSDEWLKHKETKIRNSSLDTYRMYVANHLGVFDKLKANQITTAKVEDFISAKEKSGMPLKTIRYIINMLNQIMNFSVRRQYRESNPVTSAERPRGVSEQKGRTLTADEVIRLLDAEKDQMYHCLFKLAVFSGARQGELLGLTWADVSFNERQIRIERTFNNGATYEPKNKTSRRRIDLGDDMLLTLREWRKSNLTSELVFPDKEGKHLQSQTVRRRFRKILKAVGLPDMRFHDIRHTCASLLVHQGENIKYIQSHLGHSTPTQTLNTYSHLMKDYNSDVADRFENMVFNGNGHKMVRKAG